MTRSANTPPLWPDITCPQKEIPCCPKKKNPNKKSSKYYKLSCVVCCWPRNKKAKKAWTKKRRKKNHETKYWLGERTTKLKKTSSPIDRHLHKSHDSTPMSFLPRASISMLSHPVVVRGGYQISKWFLGNRPNIIRPSPPIPATKEKTRKTKKEKRPTKNDIHGKRWTTCFIGMWPWDVFSPARKKKRKSNTPEEDRRLGNGSTRKRRKNKNQETKKKDEGWKGKKKKRDQEPKGLRVRY